MDIRNIAMELRKVKCFRCKKEKDQADIVRTKRGDFGQCIIAAIATNRKSKVYGW